MTRSKFPVAWATAVAVMSTAVAGVAWQGITHAPAGDDAAHEQAQSPDVIDEPAPGPPEADPAAAPVQADAHMLTPEHSPWAPGVTFNLTNEYPEPGVPFSATECTVALSFTGADGRMYAVTASHCGDQGDLIFPRDGETMDDYTSELGRVMWSGLDEPGSSEDSDRRPDVAIIQITNPDRLMVAGGEPPLETILASHPDGQGEACKIGGTTGRTCGDLGPRDQRYVMMDPESGAEVRSVGDTANLCAQRGDSGGPVLADVAGREAVIGLVSGTRSDVGEGAPECTGDGISSAAGSIAYATTDQVLDVIYTVVPDAVFTPVDEH